MKLKYLGGAGMASLAGFSILNLPQVSSLGIAQSLLIVGILCATFTMLWGKNAF